MPQFYNSIPDILRKQANLRPEEEALVYRDRRITFSALDKEVDRLAQFLLDLGLEKGDRVAVYCEKSPEEAASFLAIARAGGVFIIVNPLLKGPQVRHILHDSGARYLFTTHQRMGYLLPFLTGLDSLQLTIVRGKGGAVASGELRILDLDAWGGPRRLSKAPQMIETDIAAIIYTSGSTGKPKGVVLSHRNLMAGVESVSAYLENTPDDRILSVLPFSFDYGLNQLTTSLYVGCACILINYLVINDILNAMERERITGLALIPPLWLQLIQKSWDHTRFPEWRYLTNSGGSLPVHATKDLRQRLPNSKLYLMYGLTEAFRGAYLPPGEVDRRPTSIGKAIPNAEILVLNDKGERCGVGEEGELVQRGAHVALGYWNDAEKTAQRFKPNPFSPPGVQFPELVVFSGDRVTIDEDGYLYFVNRADEMIKTSGYRVSPTEVEEALYATGLVGHAVVFGIHDDILGQAVAAVITGKDGVAQSIDELKAVCSQVLPSYMIPKRIEQWDSVPLNPNGKIDRPAVKQIFIERQSDAISAQSAPKTPK